ncbi:hypothetical protein [Rhizobium sp. SAFR-030]|uniref:hypothetical protein n=1 Tax=Rhizobium sp. SAFR-030 TaxID=3387277 RepID=UPI003F7ED05E
MSYCDDTEYAARNLIELAMAEDNALTSLQPKLVSAEAKYKANHWDFSTSDLNDDFSDAHVMSAFRRMAEAHNEANSLRTEIASLQASIGARQVALQALCGALLQLAKQGISLVHGSLNACPNGRMLANTSLKEVVWQARNQAIHYEEGNFRQAVTTVFSDLEASFGQEFSLSQHVGQSRARQVTKLLGWTAYDNYSTDMKLLGL